MRHTTPTMAAAFAVLTTFAVVVHPSTTAAAEILPYEVEVTDAVSTPLDEFRTEVIDTLDDPRGWELGGTIDLRYTDDGGVFTVGSPLPPRSRRLRPSAAVSGAVTSAIGH